jgi:ribosomal protein S18 acetylase RimI-like enzyme
MKIRTANKNDINEIIKLKLTLFSKWDKTDPIDKIELKLFNSNKHKLFLEKEIKDKNKKILVALVKDNANNKQEYIGYIKAEIIQRELFLKKVGYISEIYIKNKYRHQEVATKLMNEIINWFKKEKIVWSTVSTHSLDKQAIQFWKKKGFCEYNKFFKAKV